MSFFFWLSVLLVCYCCWRLLKLLRHFLKEYYTLWCIAEGGGREEVEKRDKPSRLHVYVCHTRYMDEVSVKELYTFLKKMMDTEVTINQFHSVLRTYKYAVICRERTDGSLRGTTLVGLERHKLNDQSYTLLRVGLGFFENCYAGGPLLYFVIGYFVIRELILHPFTPLYGIGKLFGYKSYMVAVNTSSGEFYPRYDCETPKFAKDIINDFGKSVKTPSEEYDEETFVLKREMTHIKEGLAEVSETALKNPHIKFFVERNPGWAKGHQLVVLGRYNLIAFGRLIWRAVLRSLWKKKGPKKKKKKSLTRVYSYQNEIYREYAATFTEIDLLSGERSVYVAERKLKSLPSVSDIDDLIL